MMKSAIRYAVFFLSLCLAACQSQTPTPAPVVEATQQKPNNPLLAFSEAAKQLNHFRYVDESHHYDVYSSSQPELIQITKAQDERQFFYRNGQLFAAKDNNGIHFFTPENANETALIKQGELLFKLFDYNQADKEIEQINTGDEAKLNYLCISKIQQVAQTRRVFRLPENAQISTNALKGTVRLNGNQYYRLVCETADNRVIKLSLIRQ